MHTLRWMETFCPPCNPSEFCISTGCVNVWSFRGAVMTTLKWFWVILQSSLICKWVFSKSLKIGVKILCLVHLDIFQQSVCPSRAAIWAISEWQLRLVFHSFGPALKFMMCLLLDGTSPKMKQKSCHLKLRGQQLWISEWPRHKGTLLRAWKAAEKSAIFIIFLPCSKTCLSTSTWAQFMSGNVLGITWFTLIAAGAKCTINYVAALK